MGPSGEMLEDPETRVEEGGASCGGSMGVTRMKTPARGNRSSRVGGDGDSAEVPETTEEVTFMPISASICTAVTECVSGVSDPFRNYILMPSCDLQKLR